MKRYIGILAILILASCSSKKTEKAGTSEPAKTEENKEALEGMGLTATRSEIKDIDWSQFEFVFTYQDQEEELIQVLGVNKLEEDSICYQIYVNSVLCESEFSGKAGLAFPGGDREMDEDESAAYSVNDYRFEGEGYVVSIRIASQDFGRARFSYRSEEGRDDCDPWEQIAMKRIR
ncbi:hypothetical protein [Labilibaculum sp.]|uniref:hypothetical protein n=1 Tax=Labilibaculum sp. TaxID=2060723 RepID=UPI00356B1198